MGIQAQPPPFLGDSLLKINFISVLDSILWVLLPKYPVARGVPWSVNRSLLVSPWMAQPQDTMLSRQPWSHHKHDSPSLTEPNPNSWHGLNKENITGSTLYRYEIRPWFLMLVGPFIKPKSVSNRYTNTRFIEKNQQRVDLKALFRENPVFYAFGEKVVSSHLLA